MKISLYPTADGCLRPDEVLTRARACLMAGQRVAVSSGDPAFDVLDGAVLVRRVGNTYNACQSIKPDVAIIDALDFTDPDGEELISRQEMPESPAVLVAGVQFRKMLDLLDQSGAKEVILVSVNDAISPAWQERLTRWGTVIHWDQAQATPWRTWSLRADENRLPTALFPAPQYEEPELKAEIHSTRSHLLLTLCAEFSDIFCKDAGSMNDRAIAVNENPDRLLMRMMAGKPVAERIRHCRQLEEDFLFLAVMVAEYHQDLKGGGPAKIPGAATVTSHPAPAPVHSISRTGRKLH